MTAQERLATVRQLIAEILINRHPPKADDLAEKVEALMWLYILENRHIRLDFLAHQLHMSSATLKRKLKESGTSFQTILDQLRCALAKQLLLTHLSVDDVSAELGFAGPPSFYRAFRDWTGSAPSAWAEQAAAA